MTGAAARLRARPGTAALVVLLALVLITAVTGRWWAPQDPARTVAAGFARPSGGLPMGTDQLGRDVLSRLLSGGVPVLVLPLLAVAVSTVVGAAVGLVLTAGRRRGAGGVAALDVLLALPAVLLLLVVSVTLGPGATTLVLVVTLVSAPYTARLTRALAAPLWDRGHVEVALAAGVSRPRVVVTELLPLLRSPLLADAGLRVVSAVYLVAAAGFLGISPVRGDGDWASMVRGGLPGIELNPWAVAAPAVAIALVTVPTNLLADRFAEVTR